MITVTNTNEVFAADVLAEIQRSRKLFPINEFQHAALVEEVGELAQALIDHNRHQKTAAQVYREAVQVAAMAARLAVEGSQEFRYDPGAGQVYGTTHAPLIQREDT